MECFDSEENGSYTKIEAYFDRSFFGVFDLSSWSFLDKIGNSSSTRISLFLKWFRSYRDLDSESDELRSAYFCKRVLAEFYDLENETSPEKLLLNQEKDLLTFAMAVHLVLGKTSSAHLSFQHLAKDLALLYEKGALSLKESDLRREDSSEQGLINKGVSKHKLDHWVYSFLLQMSSSEKIHLRSDTIQIFMGLKTLLNASGVFLIAPLASKKFHCFYIGEPMSYDKAQVEERLKKQVLAWFPWMAISELHDFKRLYRLPYRYGYKELQALEGKNKK